MSGESSISALEKRVQELESELADAHRAIDEFFHILPVAMFECRLADFRITMMNRLARVVFGYAQEGPVAELYLRDIVTPEAYLEVAKLVDVLYERGRQPDGGYRRRNRQEIHETVGRRSDGSSIPIEHQGVFVLDSSGVPFAFRTIVRDISERKAAEAERERLLGELQDALANVRRLEGLLPICAWCRKVRDDGGYWRELETYIRHHSDAEFSHGICPQCAEGFERGETPQPQR